jgi:hypothetical protein
LGKSLLPVAETAIDIFPVGWYINSGKELKLFFKGGLRRGTRVDIQLTTKHLLDINSELIFLFFLTIIISNV